MRTEVVERHHGPKFLAEVQSVTTCVANRFISIRQRFELLEAPGRQCIRLTIAAERLSDTQRDRLMGLLRAGDPTGEVWYAWNAKEIVRQIYDHTDPDLAIEWVTASGRDFTDAEMPPEVRRLGRTITRWAGPICAWHRSHVTNGPTEAINNHTKRVKRVAYGLTNFRHHRVRCLLYAGQPDWALLATTQP